MRLRWGPHRDRSPKQVLLRDPLYVLEVLDGEPDGVLAAIFRDLVLAFDGKPLATSCVRCGGAATGLCAYPASVALIGHCHVCRRVALDALCAGATRIAGYEDALRHVASSFRRGLRPNMRRMIAGLCEAKGGPRVAPEPACRAFLST